MSALKSKLSLNSDTDVELNLESNDITDKDSLEASMMIEHSINDKNSIAPKFCLNSGEVSYEYKRNLSDDAELVANVSPGKNVEVEWEDQGSKGLWTTTVSTPWGKPESSTVSVKRKFDF